MEGKKLASFKVHIDYRYGVTPPTKAGAFTYPNGLWQRFMTSGLNDADNDFVREALSDQDNEKAQEFREVHTSNIFQMMALKEKMAQQAIKKAKIEFLH